MENFLIAVNGVVPLFFFIAMGLLIKDRKIMSETEINHFNRMLFRIFFFCMLFSTIYGTDVSQSFRPRLMLFGVAALLIMYCVTFGFVCCIEKSNKRRGAMIQAIYRSNFVIMGIPLVTNIYGDKDLGITTMMIAVIIPLYNILGVMTLEIFRGRKLNIPSVLKGIVTNPLIQGAVCGALFLFLGIKVPAPILKPINQMATATSMLALIVLGASFHLSSTKYHLPQLIICVLGRLIVFPACVLAAALWLGFRDVELMTLIAIFASPGAVVGFTMAQQMDSDADLAGNNIVFTTGFSALTVCSWIFLFKSYGFM